MKAERIKQAISAAMALHSAAPAEALISERAQGMEGAPPTDYLPGHAQTTPASIKASTTIQVSMPTSQFSTNWPRAAQWDDKAKRRYKKLAVQEALGTLDAKGQVEIVRLDALRLRAENTATADELIVRYREEKTGLEMLEILGKYVRVTHQK